MSMEFGMFQSRHSQDVSGRVIHDL
jgi:hypothetical protein